MSGIDSAGTALSSIFDALRSGQTPIAAVGIVDGSSDMASQYAPLSYGSAAAATGISTASADLNTKFAKIGTSGGLPHADYTWTTSALVATFTDVSTDPGGTIGSWAWNFGDGGTSTAQNPSHTFASANTYNVMLTVTDSRNGKTSSASYSVAVTSSGGSSGGGSGCAVVTAFIGDRRITDYAANDPLPVMNDLGEFHEGHVVKISGTQWQPCVRIVTAKGCALSVSTTTPVIIGRGVTKWSRDLVVGDPIAVRIDGEDSWDTITAVEPVGDQQVLLLNANDLSFPAGETPTHLVYTHNTIHKN